MALGNVLDVSDSIKNGKIRLDNIAPTLSISLSSSGSIWYWVFSFDDGDGSGFKAPTENDVSCLSIADKTSSSESYNMASRATYSPFSSRYYKSVLWKRETHQLLTLTMTGDDRSFNNILDVGGNFWLKILALDRAGNHTWGGQGADACYVLGKYAISDQGPFRLSVVLKS